MATDRYRLLDRVHLGRTELGVDEPQLPLGLATRWICDFSITFDSLFVEGGPLYWRSLNRLIPDSNVLVGHQWMPPVASGGPPHICSADSGWLTSYIVCRRWNTGGPSVAISGKSHSPIPACEPLVVQQCFFAAHSRWWATGVMLSGIWPGRHSLLRGSTRVI